MRDRKNQLLLVKRDVSELTAAGKNVAEMSFKKLRAVLVDGFRVPNNVDANRYTAMVINYARKSTIDEDVLWHV